MISVNVIGEHLGVKGILIKNKTPFIVTILPEPYSAAKHVVETSSVGVPQGGSLPLGGPVPRWQPRSYC